MQVILTVHCSSLAGQSFLLYLYLSKIHEFKKLFKTLTVGIHRQRVENVGDRAKDQIDGVNILHQVLINDSICTQFIKNYLGAEH